MRYGAMGQGGGDGMVSGLAGILSRSFFCCFGY